MGRIVSRLVRHFSLRRLPFGGSSRGGLPTCASADHPDMSTSFVRPSRNAIEGLAQPTSAGGVRSSLNWFVSRLPTRRPLVSAVAAIAFGGMMVAPSAAMASATCTNFNNHTLDTANSTVPNIIGNYDVPTFSAAQINATGPFTIGDTYTVTYQVTAGHGSLSLSFDL